MEIREGYSIVCITYPANTKAANYVVDALTQSGMDANYTTGVKHLAITATAPTASPTTAATPTVTATTAATTTPVSTVTPTTIPARNNTGSQTSRHRCK